jgi:hypothetical protein
LQKCCVALLTDCRERMVNLKVGEEETQKKLEEEKLRLEEERRKLEIQEQEVLMSADSFLWRNLC